jgi:hypothetical protein
MKTKGLWVSSSIGGNINKTRFEAETVSDISYARAYTVAYDESARFPAKNFSEVVPSQLSSDNFDWLGMQGGSVEISNIDTSLDPREHMEYWKQQIHIATETMFNIARDALKNNPNLKKVVIMKRVPRYDTIGQDDDIKANLTKYGNSLYDKLWLDAGCPKNIFIGEHNLDCYGGLREMRYGKEDMQTYDGIHLRGKLGEAHYTTSVLSGFKLAFPYLQNIPTKQPQSSNTTQNRNSPTQQVKSHNSQHYNNSQQHNKPRQHINSNSQLQYNNYNNSQQHNNYNRSRQHNNPKQHNRNNTLQHIYNNNEQCYNYSQQHNNYNNSQRQFKFQHKRQFLMETPKQNDVPPFVTSPNKYPLHYNISTQNRFEGLLN